MIDYIFLALVSFTELLISYIVFSHIFDSKHSVFSCLFFGTLLFESAVAVNVFLSNNIVVNGIYFAVINIIFALAFFRISPVKAIFYSITLDIFSTALEFVTIVLFSAIFKVNINDYNSNTSLLIIEGTVSKALYFILCLAIIRLIESDKEKVRFPLSLYIYPFSVIAALLVFWKICLENSLSTANQIVLSAVGILLFGATIILFITYQRNVQKVNRILSAQSEISRLETEKTYYEILERQDEQLLSYAHDAKNHLAIIKNLNKDETIDSYIDEMSESLKSYNSISRSGNKALDVIINKYTTECDLKNISFDYDVRATNLKCIYDYDLVSILGNLLDNAVEASEKSLQKFISFKTNCVNSYDVIIISNSCDNAPNSRGEKLITTKSNTSIHNIGIKNVKKAAAKYDGDMSWNYDRDKKTFTATVMIRNRIREQIAKS